MSKVEEATRKFCAVRDALEPNTPIYRLAFTKKLLFYYEHTTEQAIEILKKEVEE